MWVAHWGTIMYISVERSFPPVCKEAFTLAGVRYYQVPHSKIEENLNKHFFAELTSYLIFVYTIYLPSFTGISCDVVFLIP